MEVDVVGLKLGADFYYSPEARPKHPRWTAELPYDGASMPELLGTMLRGEPPDPWLLQPTLPAPAGLALLRALKPSPEDRFATAHELGVALLQP